MVELSTESAEDPKFGMASKRTYVANKQTLEQIISGEKTPKEATEQKPSQN
jgi:hypothetical protein